MRFFLLAAALLAPLAGAQGMEVALAGEEPSQIPANEETLVPLVLRVDCLLVAQAGGELRVIVETDMPPSWRPQPLAVDFTAGPECLTGNQTAILEQEASLAIEPHPDAVALLKRPLTIYANATDAADTVTIAAVWIEYVAGHHVAVKPPATDSWRIEMHVRFLANGQSMLMFRDVHVNKGTVSGFGDLLFAPGSDRLQTRVAQWHPPPAWTEATLSFRAFSHCMADGMACDDIHETRHNLTMYNPQEPVPAPEKKSPAPLATVAAAVLLALLQRR